MESANGQRLDEHRALLGRDDVLAIRLAVIGGELSQKLVVRDAGGRIQAGDVLDLGADGQRDVACERNPLQVFGDVEVSLVERQWFYDRRVLGENLADLLGDRLVDLEARLYEDKVWTLSFGRHRRHGRSDAELTGLVARGRHDAALAGSADGDRLAAKVGIVPLFHGCIEGVHVDVMIFRWRGGGPAWL